MLHECMYGECAHEQHVWRTLTLTHMVTAYLVSGNVRVHIPYSSVQLDKSRVEEVFRIFHGRSGRS